MSITNDNGNPMFLKDNQDIQKNFPHKANCKTVNADNFTNFKEIEDNKVYVVHLITANQSHRIFRGYFCMQTEKVKKFLSLLKITNS